MQLFNRALFKNFNPVNQSFIKLMYHKHNLIFLVFLSLLLIVKCEDVGDL